MKSLEQLHTQAEQIEEAVLPNSNTANLVGDTIKGIIEILQKKEYGPISGYIHCDSLDELPTEPTASERKCAWIVSSHLYVWVGTGGDTLDGLYQDCGTVQGPPGKDGADGISIGDDWTAFSEVSALDGKTDEQKAAMVPDGAAVEEMAKIGTTLTGTTYSNRVINGSGASVQPSSSNGNRLVVVFDISQFVGQTIDFSSYNNYANAYSWAVWKGDTKVSSTGLSQNTDVRVMSEATSAKGGYTGHITVEEGDRFLALVGYSSHDTDAKASIAVKEVVSKNAEAVKQNKEDITAVNTYTRSYSPVATYPNRIINASGASVQPSSGNANRLVVVFDISQLIGVEIALSAYNGYDGAYSWAVLREGTTWSATGLTQNTDARVISDASVAAGVYTGNIVVQPGDKWLAMVNYNGKSVDVMNLVTPLGDKIRELDGLANPEEIKEYNNMSSFALKVKNLAHGTGLKPLVLAHFSDIHGNGKALSRMLSWCSMYGNYIDDILHTGDTVESKYSDGMAFWDNAGADGILNIIGNHDASTSSNGNGGKSQAECYDLVMAPYIDDWRVVQPDGVDDSSSPEYKACYWYKDYTTKNVRLIALDCMVKATGTAEQVETQLAWLHEVLLDAAEKNMTVVAAYHSHPLSAGYDRVECPFSHMTAGNVGAYNWPSAAQMITDYVNNNLTGQVTAGKFACWLCGHQHKDVVVWYDTYGQLSIAIDSMSLSVTGRDISGKGQDCFNLVGIDTANHIVKLLRIGNDVDAQMRKIDMCSINYTTGKVVGVYYPTIPDVSGKEDKVAVAIISGTTLAAAVSTYYVGSSVGTLAVTLPTPTDATTVASVVLNIATGSSPAVTFTAESGVTISYSKDFALEASKEYEVNCLWQGTKWIIMAVEVETPS